MTVSELHALFLNPSNAYRGKPFWSWNGHLEQGELIRQIHVLRRMGMGGFFMHSRTGLATPYLGREWFDLINACSDEAERLGMEAWLYDEDRWPSGTAGGMVTQDPAFRRRYVRMEECAPADVRLDDHVIAVFVCRKDGFAVRDVRRIEPSAVSAQPSSLTALVFRDVEMAPASFYNGFTYVDTMNPDATARFIELTHEQYARHCGSRLGGVIKGIFTDEPHRGALMDRFGGEGLASETQAPWNDRIRERFREAFGYDIVDRLPELFLQPDGQPISQVKWHYVELLMRMFLDGFAKPYEAWCREHGIAVTGHVLHEDGLAAQTAMCRSVMRYYEHMDCPGIDLLTEGNRSYWVAKQLQSVARQLGQRVLLSELYGCTGWQMPFKGHKAVGDWQALYGINLRCHHLSWYTMEGEAKRDFPASIFHQSAWWRAYKHVEDYFSRIGLLMDQGERLCDLLVVHPVESVWCQVYPGWSRFLGATGPAVQVLERRFAEMFHWLQTAQMDFDYGDEDILGRLGSVGADGSLKVGQAAYKAVVIGGMTTIRSTTLDLLRRFAEAGGTVIVAGDPPTHVDALPASDSRVAHPGFTEVAWERGSVVAACEASVERIIAVETSDSERPPSVVSQVRRDAEGRTYVMVLNLDRDHGTPAGDLRLRARGPLEEWNPLTGERLSVEWRQDGEWLVSPLRLEPAGSRLYVAGLPGQGAIAQTERAARTTVAVSGPFAYRLSEPNVCVLDMCSWRLDDGAWSPRAEVLKADQAVRRNLGLQPRGGEMLQPWFTAQRGHATLGTVQTRFTFSVDRVPSGPVELVIERPDLQTATVNGASVAVPPEPRRWLDVCFARLPLPDGCLRAGDNEVVITTQYHEGIGLEAVYLLGEFGVRVEGSCATLTELPPSLEVGDLTAQGLPFYSGAIALKLACPRAGSVPSDVAAGPVAIRLNGMSAACALAVPPGTPLPNTCSLDLGEEADPVGRIIAWDPYEAEIGDLVNDHGEFELHLYLTRRNTFGPLHQIPMDAPGYGPGNWITEGPAFSESHVLWPSGLLEPPELVLA